MYQLELMLIDNCEIIKGENKFPRGTDLFLKPIAVLLRHDRCALEVDRGKQHVVTGTVESRRLEAVLLSE